MERRTKEHLLVVAPGQEIKDHPFSKVVILSRSIKHNKRQTVIDKQILSLHRPRQQRKYMFVFLYSPLCVASSFPQHLSLDFSLLSNLFHYCIPYTLASGLCSGSHFIGNANPGGIKIQIGFRKVPNLGSSVPRCWLGAVNTAKI